MIISWKGIERMNEMKRLRIRRYVERTGKGMAEQNSRMVWYELGFRDGWVAAMNLVEESNKKRKD